MHLLYTFQKKTSLFPAVFRFGYTVKLFGVAFFRPTKFWSNRNWLGCCTYTDKTWTKRCRGPFCSRCGVPYISTAAIRCAHNQETRTCFSTALYARNRASMANTTPARSAVLWHHSWYATRIHFMPIIPIIWIYIVVLWIFCTGPLIWVQLLS